jgi:hypothetical protein
MFARSNAAVILRKTSSAVMAVRQAAMLGGTPVAEVLVRLGRQSTPDANFESQLQLDRAQTDSCPMRAADAALLTWIAESALEWPVLQEWYQKASQPDGSTQHCGNEPLWRGKCHSHRWLACPLTTRWLNCPDWPRGTLNDFHCADCRCLAKKTIWPTWYA